MGGLPHDTIFIQNQPRQSSLTGSSNQIFSKNFGVQHFAKNSQFFIRISIWDLGEYPGVLFQVIYLYIEIGSYCDPLATRSWF